MVLMFAQVLLLDGVNVCVGGIHTIEDPLLAKTDVKTFAFCKNRESHVGKNLFENLFFAKIENPMLAKTFSFGKKNLFFSK